MIIRGKILVALLLVSALHVDAFDRHRFKTCARVPFCARFRKFLSQPTSPVPDTSRANDITSYIAGYRVVEASHTTPTPAHDLEHEDQRGDLQGRALSLMLTNHPGPDYQPTDIIEVVLTPLKNGRVRIVMDEPHSSYKRFRVPDKIALSNYPRLVKTEDVDVSVDSKRASMSWHRGRNRVVVDRQTARFDFFVDGVLQVVLNGDGKLNFERHRSKPVKRTEQELPRLTLENVGDSTTESAHYSDPVSLSPSQNSPVSLSANGNSGENDLGNKESEQDSVSPGQTQTPKVYRDAVDVDDRDTWGEYFSSFYDSMPNGPMAIGVQTHFCNKLAFHGFAEHPVRYDLPRDFTGPDKDEPYRFYNLDVAHYEVNSPTSLYASIPLLHVPVSGSQTEESNARKQTGVLGALWNSGADTFAILGEPDTGPAGRKGSSHAEAAPVGTCKGGQSVWWLSETGVVDLTLFLGASSQRELTMQYSGLTGYSPMPQLATLGLHQSRWSFHDQDDVRMVDRSFDNMDIPYDYMWLDIDHADERRYFTWDDSKYKDPQKMLDDLAAVDRQLVLIVDPHVKKDSSYPVDIQFTKTDTWTKNVRDEVYDGWCWPGASRYPDMLRDDAIEFYKSFYRPESWRGTAIPNNDVCLHNPKSCPGLTSEQLQYKRWMTNISRVQIWNDMQEPSVFNGPEVTMPKDNKHLKGRWEHREVHNLYGQRFTQGSYAAIVSRGDDGRPFTLTRAASPGSHRWGAIWTGDNTATWEQLRISLPMVLTLSDVGFSFNGADIAGFFDDPDDELQVRWMQAGIWYPFFRSHAHADTKRREASILERHTRPDLQLRYRLLPFWYTLFARHAQEGVPVLSSIADFNWRFGGPVDKTVHERDDGYLIGDVIFSRPIMYPFSEYGKHLDTNESHPALDFKLPGSETTVWYDAWTSTVAGQGTHEWRQKKENHIDRSPVFVRGGTVLPIKEIPRRSSQAMRFDPHDLIVFLDSNGEATGEIFLDDYTSRSSVEKNENARVAFKVTSNGCRLQFTSTPHLNAAPVLWSQKLNTTAKAVTIVGMKPECGRLASASLTLLTEAEAQLSFSAKIAKAKTNVDLLTPFAVKFEFNP